MRACFADASAEEGDLVIGCDGVHSTVRELIDPRAHKPAYSGLLTTGGYVQGVPVDTEPGSYEMIFGKRAFFGYALAPDRCVWWFANVPRSDEPARGALDTSNGDLRHQLIDLFDGDAGPAVALIAATEAPTPLSPIHTLAHLPKWHRGRSVVIGDAAHAPSPTSGQGASLSIEDALVLAKCLRDIPDYQQAFNTFVAQRRPRVERIIKWAGRINNNKAPGPIAAAIRESGPAPDHEVHRRHQGLDPPVRVPRGLEHSNRKAIIVTRCPASATSWSNRLTFTCSLTWRWKAGSFRARDVAIHPDVRAAPLRGQGCLPYLDQPLDVDLVSQLIDGRARLVVAGRDGPTSVEDFRSEGPVVSTGPVLQRFSSRGRARRSASTAAEGNFGETADSP